MSEPELIGNILDKSSESLKESQLACAYKGCDGVIDDYKCSTCGKAPLGGKRPGSGFPKGAKKKKTIDKMKANDHFRTRTLLHLDRLYNAQMSLAVGEQVLMVQIKDRDSKGKVTKITHDVVRDIDTIKQYLDNEEGSGGGDELNDSDHYYYLTTKPANNQALDSLLNRALGKAPDKLEIEGGFFDQPQLTIKVVGSKHDNINIGDDGQLHLEGAEEDSSGAGTDGERTSEPSDPSS